MAYPNSRLRSVVARAFNNADSTVVRLRALAGALDAQMASGPVPARTILEDLLEELRSSRVTLISSRDTSGILDYARDQFGDATIDLPAEFLALLAAIDMVIAWIVVNFPVGTGGFIQQHILAADGSMTDRSFSSGQTAGLRTELQALVAAIE